MPTLNGITASICTHDGQLEEFGPDEFPDGVSCYIPAHSGQQFWLSYSIDQPIRAKALSVEFYADGNRIDTQFPFASSDSDPPTIGPVKSRITSQYGKDEEGTVYRRDVFFTLVDKASKSRSYWQSSAGELGNKIGILECKVYRAEKTGEWDGSISPEELVAGNSTGSLKEKGISHKARLGANIPSTKTVRYTFNNLDSEDAPFAYFKFYYRSRRFLESNGFIPLSVSIPAGSNPSRPSSPLPRPLSRVLAKKGSIYKALGRKKSLPAEKVDEASPNVTTKTDPLVETARRTASNLESSLAKLESEINKAKKATNAEVNEIMQSCYEKLARLRKSTEVLRGKFKEAKGREEKEKAEVLKEVYQKKSDLKGKGKEVEVLGGLQEHGSSGTRMHEHFKDEKL